MSSPLRNFQDLNIREMAASRGSRASGPRASAFRMPQPQRDIYSTSDEEDDDSESDDDDDDDDEGSAASARTSPLQSPTRLKYDVRRFSPDAYQKAKDGLKAKDRYRVTTASEKVLEQDGEERDRYYAIEIMETTRASVRFGSPRGQYASPRCTCRSPGDNTACRHIYLLLDQIRSSTQGLPTNDVFQLSESGFIDESENLYQRIREIGLTTVAARNHWYVPGQYESTSQQRPTPDRKVEVREILAGLSEQTREEYRPDIFDNFPDVITREDVLVPRDLEATLARCLYVDSAFFNSFRNMVPAELYYEELFEKMKDRAQQSLTNLEEYIEQGPEASEEVDVQMCARQLLRIVEIINQNLLNARVPLNEDAYTSATAALVFILRAVALRNKDAYSEITWQRRPVAGETPPDRNLYQLLVCSLHAPTFVLEVLHNLGNAAAKFVDRLEEIYNIIRNNGAPERYNAKFAYLIRKLKTSRR